MAEEAAQRLTVPAPDDASVMHGVASCNALQILLPKLTYREREILKLRYGLSGGVYTLAEVGRIFKITKERVRQIEYKGIRRLQHFAAQLIPA